MRKRTHRHRRADQRAELFHALASPAMPAEQDLETISDDEFADLMFRKLEEAPAVMSVAEIDDVERLLNGPDGWRTRRAGLVMLTKSGAELINLVGTNRQFAAAMARAQYCLCEVIAEAQTEGEPKDNIIEFPRKGHPGGQHHG